MAMQIHSENIKLRTIIDDDLEILYRIFKESRQDLNQIVSLKEREQILRNQFEIDTVQISSLYPKAENNLILYKDQPIGRVCIDRSDKNIRLIWIGLLQEYRGMGIGAFLLKSILLEAGNCGKGVSLQVSWFNSLAYRFYIKNGFKEVEDKGVCVEMKWSKNSQNF
jgi:GNAT superfamily N-acetyltransferase